MRKKLKAVMVLCLLGLIIPVPASGSRPVDTIIVGCVIDGMLFDVGDALPVTKVYMITVIPSLCRVQKNTPGSGVTAPRA